MPSSVVFNSCLPPASLHHSDLYHHTQSQPWCWPLANLSPSRFRVRAADSQPIGWLPRGMMQPRDVRDPGTPLMFLRVSKEGKARVCLQHLKFREGRSTIRDYTDHEERAGQCINKCQVKTSMTFSQQIEPWCSHLVLQKFFNAHKQPFYSIGKGIVLKRRSQWWNIREIFLRFTSCWGDIFWLRNEE